MLHVQCGDDINSRRENLFYERPVKSVSRLSSQIINKNNIGLLGNDCLNIQGIRTRFAVRYFVENIESVCPRIGVDPSNSDVRASARSAKCFIKHGKGCSRSICGADVDAQLAMFHSSIVP